MAVMLRRIFLAGLLSLFAAAPAAAQEAVEPYFVSLKADKVNVRVGPGKRYRLKWTYVQAGIPVEIIAKWDHWRMIRDWEGQEGWVHSAMLTGKRTVIVTGEPRLLLRRADENAPPVARLQPGMVAEVEDCPEGWCRVEVRNFRGWLKRGEFWGVYPDEIIE